MGGGLHNNKLVDHQVLLGDAVNCEMFRRRGWLDYCLSLKGFDEEVTLQLMRTLQNCIIVVKCSRIEFTTEVLEEVIGFPQEGKNWDKEFDLRTTGAQYNVHQDPPLDVDKK